MQRKLDSKIAYIAQIESNTKIEYIEVVKDSIIYINNNPNNIKIPFKYDDKWLKIDGENNLVLGDEFDITTHINEISINTPLTVGLTNDYQIFIKSPNPYVNITDINGAVIDNSKLYPKKKRFSWGLQMGFGAMYDVIHNNISVGPYGGIGAEFKF